MGAHSLTRRPHGLTHAERLAPRRLLRARERDPEGRQLTADDAMVAAALIDRLVHHATMIALKGKSYRLRERGLDVVPAAQAPSLRDSA
jgi:IstB-like ATP binding protein